MTLIGPRPQLVRDMVFMSDEQRMRHTAKPGLSGLAQVSGRNAISWDKKLQYDLPKNKDMNGFIFTASNKRRQEIEKFWRINGAIYFTDVDFLLENTFLYRKGCYGYMMEQSHSIDIDTELDFVIAESVMKKFSGGGDYL